MPKREIFFTVALYTISNHSPFVYITHICCTYSLKKDTTGEYGKKRNTFHFDTSSFDNLH